MPIRIKVAILGKCGNEWMNEWMNEWISQSMNGGMKVKLYKK